MNICSGPRTYSLKTCLHSRGFGAWLVVCPQTKHELWGHDVRSTASSNQTVKLLADRKPGLYFPD